MWRGWKMATTACWEFPQLWGSLPTVLNHWNLFLHFDCRGRTSSTPESSAKPWLAPSTWPTLIAAGVSTMELVNPRELPNCEYAKVAEGGVWSFFDWCRVFCCFFFNLAKGEKKNPHHSIWRKDFWITLHVQIVEKVLSAENAEIKYWLI